jgi:Zn-dependent alcohol dehydrogenase
MMTLSGRLFKIFQCENSPKFVVWDSDNFNPIARGQYAHNQFWAYANTSRPPILSLTKNNVTVLADSETLKAMSQSQVYLIKNDLGITLNTALGQVNLEGMRKEFDYVSINLVRGFGLNFIQMIWHSKDGRMFATNLDLNTKQISVAN